MCLLMFCMLVILVWLLFLLVVFCVMLDAVGGILVLFVFSYAGALVMLLGWYKYYCRTGVFCVPMSGFVLVCLW